MIIFDIKRWWSMIRLDNNNRFIATCTGIPISTNSHKIAINFTFRSPMMRIITIITTIIVNKLMVIDDPIIMHDTAMTVFGWGYGG